ncbi:metalloprotease [Halobacteriales archaeon SW_7_68_16]|nr:MAG: metalloprotease [Halobacteriales archaeon SW_7_68_16]
MRKFRIGSLFGIPIRLDVTFLLVLPLFAYLIGSDVGSLTPTLNDLFGRGIDAGPLTTGSTPFVVGTVATLGLFVGIVLHELGHSLVAMRYGYGIDSITLWIFGGIASLREMPEDWREEFAIAIAGPIVSVVLGGLFYAVLVVLPTSLDAARFVVGYLALLNVGLAAFNMLPGFPMDGGRVLRALLARRRPYAQATRIAAEVGKAFALLLGILGVFSNILLVGIAFFIYIGASGEAEQVTLKATFEGVTVRDLMTPESELRVVDPDTSIATLVERMFRERHTGYPVLDGPHLVGMITRQDVQDVPDVERDAYRVEDVMSTDLETIGPDEDAMTAIATMRAAGVGRLPVTDEEGELLGLISRTDLMTAFDLLRSGRGTGQPLSDLPPSETGPLPGDR